MGETFIDKTWRSIVKKEIPSLVALSSSKVYFELSKRNECKGNACVVVGPKKSSNRKEKKEEFGRSLCRARASWWKFINGVFQSPNITIDTSFAVDVKAIKKRSIEELEIPRELYDLFRFKKNKNERRGICLEPGEIFWRAAEKVETFVENRVQKWQSYFINRIFFDKHAAAAPECVLKLESLLNCYCGKKITLAPWETVTKLYFLAVATKAGFGGSDEEASDEQSSEADEDEDEDEDESDEESK